MNRLTESSPRIYAQGLEGRSRLSEDLNVLSSRDSGDGLIHWPAFLRAWQPHPADFDDRRWLPNSVRRAKSDELNAAVTAWTVTFETRELVRLLQEAGVPCLAVNRPSDFVNDEQVVARELFTPAEHHRFGTYRQIRFPAMIDGQRPPATQAPSLGQDTDQYRSAIAARGDRG